MIVRPSQLRPIPSFLLGCSQSRCLHSRVPASRIPSPTPFVPDAQTFLTLIGRNLSQHASKIPSWEALFSLTSTQLRELGVDPPRSRRYLLRWREKFRNGEYGICGDAKSVVDGAAEVRVIEVPRAAREPSNSTASKYPSTRKIIANIPAGTDLTGVSPEKIYQIEGLQIKGAHTITGPHVQPVKGFEGKVAKIVVKEGLWEDRRGHKIDGGERRQAEVRAKKRSEARKAR